MDWKRAKKILILVFIVLNLVLAITLYRNIRGGEVSQETIYTTQKILEQNNVHIERPIPRYTGKDYLLQYEETFLDKDEIVYGLLGDNYTKISDNNYKKDTEQVVFTNDYSFEYSDSGSNKKILTQSKSEIDGYLKTLIKKLGLPLSEFQLDSFYSPVVDTSAKAVYKGIYEGYSVFDNYIEAEVGDSGLKSLKFHYKKPKTITSRDVRVIPVYQILISKMTKYPGIYISDVDIGFKGLTKVDKDTKTLYEGLSWRIKTTEGKEFYFNATNGESIE